MSSLTALLCIGDHVPSSTAHGHLPEILSVLKRLQQGTPRFGLGRLPMISVPNIGYSRDLGTWELRSRMDVQQIYAADHGVGGDLRPRR